MLVLRKLLAFLLPGGGVLLAAIGLVHWHGMDEWFPTVDRAYPLLVLVAGLIVGWRFHRSKLIFSVCSLVLLERALFFLGGPDTLSRAGADAVWAAVAFILPLGLASTLLVQEKGVLSMHGVCRSSLVLLQWPAVYILSRYPHLRICQWLQMEFSSADWMTRLPITQLGLLLFAIALGMAVIAYLQHRSAFEGGYFWALMAAFLGLLSRGDGSAATIYISSGALILLVSAIEVSFGLAFRDELTGLPARRAMNEALLRLSGHYTLAMADIDHFKKFNDRFGHEVGDQVLRMVASQLSRVRGGGKAYRYGGEEFAILFAAKKKADATPHLERVRKEIEDLDFVIRGPRRPRRKPVEPRLDVRARKKAAVTISVGVADSTQHADDPLAVLHLADKALYRAKGAGRNRVSL